MAMELRAATAADVAHVIALWAVSAENTSRSVDTPEMVQALICRDPEALVLSFVDAALVGSVIAGWGGWRFHLYRLAVHPAHRRRGVARSLLDRAEARFVELGATRVDAMVLDDNELGCSLWEAHGYGPQDDWSRWVKSV